MDLQLQDRRALVTGSTAGIGFAIASRLAAEGASVVVNSRSQGRVDEAIQKIRSEHGDVQVTGIAADLSAAEGVRQVIGAHPELEILVHNMSTYEMKPFGEITDEDWTRFFETNVLSGIRLCRHYFPRMLAKDWGRILFIASESAINIPEEMIHYGMTKSAQLSVARGLAEMTKGTQVTVNTVLPGPTRTEGLEDFLDQFGEGKDLEGEALEKAFIQEARPSSLIQRMIEPDEVADTVAFLASPRAAATNGAPVRVEGGVLQTMC